MDEGKIPGGVINIIVLALLLLVLQAVLFTTLVEKGILVISGVIVYMVSFSIMDKMEEKREIENAINFNSNWFETKYTLSKEVP